VTPAPKALKAKRVILATLALLVRLGPKALKARRAMLVIPALKAIKV